MGSHVQSLSLKTPALRRLRARRADEVEQGNPCRNDGDCDEWNRDSKQIGDHSIFSEADPNRAAEKSETEELSRVTVCGAAMNSLEKGNYSVGEPRGGLIFNSGCKTLR
jgi:hypothetical protein